MPRPAVAIVGAGVTGLSIAFHLAERGIGPVRVYERAGVGAGASGVQPGGVRLQWGTEVNCRMALESMEFWRNTKADFGFRACGYLWVAHSYSVLDKLRTNVALQNSLGIPSRIVGPDEAAELDAQTVVVAAGVDTPRLVNVPMVAEERYLFFGDGRVLASDLAGQDRSHVRAVMRELLPQLEFARLDTLVAGTYDVTPDHQAIRGQIDERVWVAAGFSGHGFMMRRRSAAASRPQSPASRPTSICEPWRRIVLRAARNSRSRPSFN